MNSKVIKVIVILSIILLFNTPELYAMKELHPIEPSGNLIMDVYHRLIEQFNNWRNK